MPAHQAKNDVERRLEADGLPLRHLVEGECGVDDAVEHHGPHVGGEQGGVGEPEQGAVRLTHVGEAAVPRARRGAAPCPGRRRPMPTWGSTVALAFSQAAANCFRPAIVAASWLGVVGTGSDSVAGGAPGVSPQVTGSLRSHAPGVEHARCRSRRAAAA